MAASGVVSLPSTVARELKKSSSYQQGSQAMADRLHDVAITKFRAALEDKNLASTAKPYVTLALVEALILAFATPCFAYRLGFACLRSYVWLGRSSFQPGTASLFRLAALQRRVAQFRSHARRVPN